jgi:hypothetical protein
MRVPADKKQSDVVVLMMTGKYFIYMTRLAVLSIANSWSELPKLIINTDSTITPDEVLESLSFWPGEIAVEKWGATAAYHALKGRKALIKYADMHPFGKKLAIILRFAESRPVVWIDSDILFFNDFVQYLPKAVPGFTCGGTEDFAAAYHEAVIKFTGCDLYGLYKFNAGLLYLSGTGVYEDFDLENLLNTIHPDYDFCTEQSIFAYIASKSLGTLWPLNIVKSFNSDSQQISAMPVKNVVARHYTSNVRHLFWREAFFKL